jgi:hypothetical protein
VHRGIAIAIVNLVTVLATVAVADPLPPRLETKRDKILRVERGRARGRRLLFCEIRQDRAGSCFGTEAPRPGDRMAVVDELHRIAELRVTGTTPKEGRDGQCNVMWEVSYEVASGAIDSSHSLTGVIGGEVGPNGHRMRDDARAKITKTADSTCRDDEQIVIGVDRDGDDKLDIAATFCTAGTGGSYGGDFYVNIWALADGRQTKVQTITPQQLQPCLH